MALSSISELVSLKGKCAIVTGAAQGFGAAISRRLGEAGATVFVSDRNVEGAEQSAERLRNLGYDAIAHSVDIADRDTVEALVDAATEGTGRVDILVNNAGIYSNYYFAQMPPQEFADTVSVNVVGTFQMSQAVTQRMIADGQGGSIVNIASVDAFNTSAEGLAHYTTSKHAIGGMTKSMAIELAAHNIRGQRRLPRRGHDRGGDRSGHGRRSGGNRRGGAVGRYQGEDSAPASLRSGRCSAGGVVSRLRHGRLRHRGVPRR